MSECYLSRVLKDRRGTVAAWLEFLGVWQHHVRALDQSRKLKTQHHRHHHRSGAALFAHMAISQPLLTDITQHMAFSQQKKMLRG